MLFVAWLPAFYIGVGFFLYEQSIQYPETRRALHNYLSGGGPGAPFGAALDVDPARATGEELEQARHTIWAWLLQTYFRHSQPVVMMLIVGLIAPPLISQDVRSRAFLLYFSRPLSRSEYILGKAVTVWTYLSLITTIPALALYVVGVLLSPELDVVLHTWDLPLRILWASVILMVPTTMLAMMLSSMTQESRYAAFAWFAIWILGAAAYAFLTSVEAFRPDADPLQVVNRWTSISPYHTLGRVQGWAFGLEAFADVRISFFILVLVSIVCLVVLYRRVSAPLRA